MNINTAIIGGNLTRDPEVRVTPSGTAIAQFTIAINRKFKDGNGADREEVSFIDCEAWGKTGENIAKFFSKGRPILVEGRLKQESWEDKASGQKRSRIKVVADRFHFVGGKNEAKQEPHTSAPIPPQAAQQLDEDVPF